VDYLKSSVLSQSAVHSSTSLFDFRMFRRFNSQLCFRSSRTWTQKWGRIDPISSRRQFSSISSSNQHIVFCFASQGYVPLEASRDLYRTSEVFRHSIKEIESLIIELHQSEESPKPRTFIPLTEYLMEESARPARVPNFTSPSSTENTHSELKTPSAIIVIVATQYALARTIQARGIQPNSVVGYSLGEYVASMVTGSLPLKAGIQFLIRRDPLFERRDLLPHEGQIATMEAPPKKALQALVENGCSGDVEIAGYPSSKSTMLAGDMKAFDHIERVFRDSGMEINRRPVNLPLHSFRIDAVANEIRDDPYFFPETEEADAKVIKGIDHWSCLGLKLPPGTPLNRKYWSSHVRGPVHFQQCIEGIYGGNFEGIKERKLVFLDMGMGPRLSELIKATLFETPEWEKGMVDAVGCIQPMQMDPEVKEREGWAFKELEKILESVGLNSEYK